MNSGQVWERIVNVKFLAVSRDEVRNARDWYQERSVATAEGFLRELDRAISLIRQTPDIWPEFGYGCRGYALRTYPFSVIFRVMGDEITIVAVAHKRRRPTYWSGR